MHRMGVMDNLVPGRRALQLLRQPFQKRMNHGDYRKFKVRRAGRPEDFQGWTIDEGHIAIHIARTADKVGAKQTSGTSGTGMKLLNLHKGWQTFPQSMNTKWNAGQVHIWGSRTDHQQT